MPAAGLLSGRGPCARVDRIGHRALPSERPITPVLPNGGDRYLSDRFWSEA
jgi:hypothetical protein